MLLMADQLKLSGAIRRNRTGQLQRLGSFGPFTKKILAVLFELYPQDEVLLIDEESGKSRQDFRTGLGWDADDSAGTWTAQRSVS